jgi:hypothetical protein
MKRPGRVPYRRRAKLNYRLYAAGLAALSFVKPLFSLALRLLLKEARPLRGRLLPVNMPVGSPVQAALSRDELKKLVEQSTGIALLHECLCRTVGGCAGYPRDLGCLVLGEAARTLHPGLGFQADREQAMARVDKALGCGLVPMVMRFKSDAALWSLDGKLLTVCFCCRCHCLVLKALRG